MAREVIGTLLAPGTVAALGALPAHGALPGLPDPSVPAARDTDPVVLTGKDLLAGGDWSVPENLTLAIPEKDVSCFIENQDISCPEEYNHYQEPDLDTAAVTGDQVQGTP